jgi:2-polyprenyl-6-methoxyphenol hydroxylase-like FAD-dependent oxidoreductase
MRNKRVLISGASVAGPALAYLLGRAGFEPTVVEVAPQLRTGGYAVDFRGATHLEALARLGVLEELRDLETGGNPIRFVDEAGRTLLHLPGDFAGGDLEVLRSDLSRILYERSRDWSDYVFGDSIASLNETAESVEVVFASGQEAHFDLVVGADGLHSQVRRLAFGPETAFVRFLGYHVAGWEFPNALGLQRESVGFNVPGKLANAGSVTSDGSRAAALFVFSSQKVDLDRRDDAGHRDLVTKTFAGVGWLTPHLLETLRQCRDLYFDAISRVDVPTWSCGRVILLGDAACGATMGGMGTGTALVAANVLAGELRLSGGDYEAAFARYEATVKPYARRGQQGGARAGRFLAPRTSLGIRARNTLLSNARVMRTMLETGREQAAGMPLDRYPA